MNDVISLAGVTLKASFRAAVSGGAMATSTRRPFGGMPATWVTSRERDVEGNLEGSEAYDAGLPGKQGLIQDLHGPTVWAESERSFDSNRIRHGAAGGQVDPGIDPMSRRP